jgi:hypothetical protein
MEDNATYWRNAYLEECRQHFTTTRRFAWSVLILGGLLIAAIALLVATTS